MVQVLEPKLSFAQAVAQGLGGGLGQGLAQGQEFAQKVALQKQKQQSLFDIFGGGESQGHGGQFKPLSPNQKAMLAIENPSAFKAYQSLEEYNEKEQAKVKDKEDIKQVIGKMSETLSGGKLGYTPERFLTKGGRRDAQYFDSLGVQLESIAKDLVSKGVLARDRFAYLLSNLPSADKTDAANAGALEAWADALEIPRPEGLEKLYGKEEKVETKKVKQGTPLTKEIIAREYKKTGGDKEKTRKVLKKMGYAVD